MTNPKIQFRLPDELAARISARTREGHSFSETVRRDVARYYELLRYALADIDLTESEAELVCDALNGAWMMDVTTPSHAKAAMLVEIEDAMRLNGASKRWGVDSDKLLTQLRSLRDFQAVALVDAVERLWADTSLTVHDVGLVRR